MAKPPISVLSKNVPFISVLIDTYNHEQFIEKAINSVLEQDFNAAEREIIVVDDGSTDHTPQIVREFEPKLRYIRKENGGQASAFNVGIPECRGQTIAFLDGDDYWLPGKLSRVAEVLAKNPTVGFVGHAIKETFPDGQERISAPAKDEKLHIQSLESARLFRVRKSFLGTSRMTMRGDIARRILPVPGHQLGCAAQEKMKRYTWKLSALRHEAVFRRAMGVKPIPTVSEPQETNGDSYSRKVVLN